MTGKLINKLGRVYWLKENGVIECEHKRISKDWLIANLLNSKDDIKGLRFGISFGDKYGFKVSDVNSIKSFFNERQTLTS